MKISVGDLINHGACDQQVERFRVLFGDGEIEITRQLCIKHAYDFDFNWAGHFLVSSRAKTWFYKKDQSLWKDYQEVKSPLWEQYLSTKDGDDSWDIYNEKVTPLINEYMINRAIAFYDATQLK